MRAKDRVALDRQCGTTTVSCDSCLCFLSMFLVSIQNQASSCSMVVGFLNSRSIIRTIIRQKKL